MPNISVGAQLYSVRDTLQTPEGVRETLTRLAQAGYRFLQCSGFAFDAADLRRLCDELGLQVKLTHMPPERILQETQQVIAEHKILGCPYVGIGWWMLNDAAGVRDFLQTFEPAMRTLRQAGLKLQYHNHDHEFQRSGNTTLLELMADESDPELLGFTLDTYWVQAGGMDIAALIRRLKGRIDVCHYKDMAMKEREQRFAPVGQGNFDWPTLVAAFEEAGAQYAFVEQDLCFGRDPVECLAESLRYLEEHNLCK